MHEGIFSSIAWDKRENAHKDATFGGEANLHYPGKYEIYNHVNEWGYPEVQITALSIDSIEESA